MVPAAVSSLLLGDTAQRAHTPSLCNASPGTPRQTPSCVPGRRSGRAWRAPTATRTRSPLLSAFKYSCAAWGPCPSWRRPLARAYSPRVANAASRHARIRVRRAPGAPAHTPQYSAFNVQRSTSADGLRARAIRGRPHAAHARGPRCALLGTGHAGAQALLLNARSAACRSTPIQSSRRRASPNAAQCGRTRAASRAAFRGASAPPKCMC